MMRRGKSIIKVEVIDGLEIFVDEAKVQGPFETERTPLQSLQSKNDGHVSGQSDGARVRRISLGGSEDG